MAEKGLIQDLQSQVEALEAQVIAAKENLAALRASHASETSASSTAAAVEHDALLKAQMDFTAIQEELSNLKSAHAQALEDAAAKVKDAELQAAEANSLKAQVEELLKEQEESAQKISELEVEILELKEIQEQADDNHARSTSQLAALQKELDEVKANMQRILDEADATKAELLSALDSAKTLHEEAMKAASIEQEKIVSRTQSLEAELQQARDAHEEALTQVRVATEKHALELEEAHNTLVAREGELSDEIKRITAELEVDILAFAAIELIACRRVRRRITMPRLTQSRQNMRPCCKRLLNVLRFVPKLARSAEPLLICIRSQMLWANTVKI